MIKHPASENSPIENHTEQMNSTQKNPLFHSLALKSSSGLSSGMVSAQKETIEIMITAMETKANILAASDESGYSSSSHNDL